MLKLHSHHYKHYSQILFVKNAYLSINEKKSKNMYYICISICISWLIDKLAFCFKKLAICETAFKC